MAAASFTKYAAKSALVTSVIGAFCVFPAACARSSVSTNGQRDGGAIPVAVAAPSDAAAEATGASAAPAFRPQLDGLGFPEGVLALTWDDGPDVHTLELAQYLKAQNIAATFFVVRAWVEGVSDDPGEGAAAFHTGYSSLPVLPDLIALGHRVGNHTRNHTLLTNLAASGVVDVLEDNEPPLDDLKRTDVHFYRVPGGAWNEMTSAAVASSPELAALVGPVRWDIDRKDWDNSLACDSTAPKVECESCPNGHLRTKPAVIAKRYLADIDREKRGIVLLHDRVGDVGSRYALDLAHVLVPALKARGYIFTAPVLAFSPLRKQVVEAAAANRAKAPVAAGAADAAATALEAAGPAVDLVTTGDVNGDGRADVCGRAGDAVWCALGKPAGGFVAATRWTGPGDRASVLAATSLFFVDLDADGRMDICTNNVMCGYAP